ncbi:MAG: hypothetical protein IIA67_07470 [Planctomycetes bacterium]|nr:hypothetical protein [Planctomycetota bacterium]
MFCDDPVRKKSDRRTIPAGRGDAILFCTRARLVSISGVYGWQPVKHGVDRMTWQRRDGSTRHETVCNGLCNAVNS